jgi:hypothetical protein
VLILPSCYKPRSIPFYESVCLCMYQVRMQLQCVYYHSSAMNRFQLYVPHARARAHTHTLSLSLSLSCSRARSLSLSLSLSCMKSKSVNEISVIVPWHLCTYVQMIMYFMTSPGFGFMVCTCTYKHFTSFPVLAFDGGGWLGSYPGNFTCGERATGTH